MLYNSQEQLHPFKILNYIKTNKNYITDFEVCDVTLYYKILINLLTITDNKIILQFQFQEFSKLYLFWSLLFV